MKVQTLLCGAMAEDASPEDTSARLFDFVTDYFIPEKP